MFRRGFVKFDGTDVMGRHLVVVITIQTGKQSTLTTVFITVFSADSHRKYDNLRTSSTLYNNPPMSIGHTYTHTHTGIIFTATIYCIYLVRAHTLVHIHYGSALPSKK